MNSPLRSLLKTTVLILLLGGASAQAVDTLTIAVVGPKSGPGSPFGEMEFNGARMAAERINAQGGGAGGRMLRILEIDDACDPKQVQLTANLVINQGIDFVVGHLCSGAIQLAASIYEDEGVLLITPAATSPVLTTRGYRMIFRTIGSDSQQGQVAGEYIAERVKPKVMAVIHDKQSYGQGIAEQVRRTVEARGVKVALFEGVIKGLTDFSPLLERLRKTGVDFVYYGGDSPELGRLLRQAREQGLQMRWMAPEGAGNKDLCAIAGDACDGLLVTLPADFAQDPANAELVAAFKARNQDPSGPLVLPTYAAVQLIAESVTATGSRDPRVIAEHLRKSTFKTPIGEVVYQDNGDLKNFRFAVYQWHKDGSRSLVQ
ncbi:MAG TPA: high-affinity branched-chain amino acid ABC transporter substrate-binding protein [Candidatus Competibacteraceae bacterium]|nr:high-affinity branched-chain amino acid ABC transporter substrate-binding protein [Candidatus Competibacteraceae bacterium]